jgi:hypothetical protein
MAPPKGCSQFCVQLHDYSMSSCSLAILIECEGADPVQRAATKRFAGVIARRPVILKLERSSSGDEVG